MKGSSLYCIVRCVAATCMILATSLVAAIPAEGTESLACRANSSFQSAANAYFVSAQLDRSWESERGILRAGWAQSEGPWEMFTICDNTDGTVSIMSQANGLWVSAEVGYGGDSY